MSDSLRTTDVLSLYKAQISTSSKVREFWLGFAGSIALATAF